MSTNKNQSAAEDIGKFFEFIGGNTRYYGFLFLYILKIKQKKYPKENYTKGPSQKEDYLGHSDTKFWNAITSLLVMFVLFSVFGKLFKVLF